MKNIKVEKSKRIEKERERKLSFKAPKGIEEGGGGGGEGRGRGREGREECGMGKLRGIWG